MGCFQLLLFGVMTRLACISGAVFVFATLRSSAVHQDQPHEVDDTAALASDLAQVENIERDIQEDNERVIDTTANVTTAHHCCPDEKVVCLGGMSFGKKISKMCPTTCQPRHTNPRACERTSCQDLMCAGCKGNEERAAFCRSQGLG